MMKWLAISFMILFSLTLFARESEEIHSVKIELDLLCPASEELQVLVNTITSEEEEFVDYQQWIDNIYDGMDKLKSLLDTGKIYEGGVSCKHQIRAQR